MTKRDYKDFLKDKDFISWRLTGDSYLEVFWEDYLESNPDQKEEFERAIREFSHVRLNIEQLSKEEEDKLLTRIHSSVGKKKTYTLHFLKYVAAASILLAIGFFLYNQSEPDEEIADPTAHLIVGENLDEEEIYLITGTETTAFSKDVHVQFDKSGSAIIQEVDGGNSKVVQTGKTVMNKLVVPYGKRSQITLADGSKVWLNSGSVLEFPSTFAGNTRSVNLTGEMYVDVTKDPNKPFLVNTPDLQIKVYGTQFNISAYQDDSAQSVVLVSGSVSVKSNTSKETYLSPNEMLVYSNQGMEKREVDINKFISWKEGYIMLEDTPIDDVLKHLERYYNLSFNIQEDINLKSRTCTGKLYLSDNLDNVMATISLLSAIKYTRDEKTIYIDINP